VALTAQAFAEQIEECRIVGMNWHLAKPFTQTTLLDVIARANAIGAASAPTPEPPAWPGADAPIFNARTFDHVGMFLDAAKLAEHKRTLLHRCHALRARLADPEELSHHRAELQSSTHALAGSALMLGFERAGHAARLFEAAIRAHSPDAERLRTYLGGILDDTIQDLHLKLHDVAGAALR
jgi:HPt (histidine-containing phosphotransfer) domain-containing protein